MEKKDAPLEQLLQECRALGAEIGLLEANAESVREKRRLLVKELSERFGRGPYEIAGESHIVIVRANKDGAYSYSLQRKGFPASKSKTHEAAVTD